MITLTEMKTEIAIKASTSRVWSVLTETDRYYEWNPFVRKIRGDLSSGGTVELELTPPDREPCSVAATVSDMHPLAAIRLTCQNPDVPGQEVIHDIVLEPVPSGTTLSQVCRHIEGEEPDTAFDDRAKLGLEMMNAALKARAER